MTSRMRAYHEPDTQQVRRGNLLVAACRLALELATSGAVLLNGSVIAQVQSIGANALPPLPPGSPAYLKETWRSALHAPMPFGATPGVIPALLPQSFTAQKCAARAQSCVASPEQPWPSTMAVSTPPAASSARL